MTKRFTEEHILAVLCEADAGAPVRTLCSKHGCCERSHHPRRSRIVGSRHSAAQHLSHLQSENEELRQLLADVLLEATPSRRKGSPTTTHTGNDLIEALLRMRSMARLATQHLFGTPLSEPLDWPELPTAESLSEGMAHESDRSEGRRERALLQQEGFGAGFVAGFAA